MSDIQTIGLWLLSFVAGAVAFHLTPNHRSPDDNLVRKLSRILFAGMVLLSFWSVSVYIFWLAGFDLKVGTIQNGKMSENWWLPGLTVVFAALVYWICLHKPSSRK